MIKPLNGMSNLYVELPIIVRPRLPKGRIHRLVLTQDRFEITTWPNIYGNKMQERLVHIPYQNIVDIDYKMPASHVATGKMQLTFYDGRSTGGGKHSLKRKTMQISVAGTGDWEAQNDLTGMVAAVIRARREQRDVFVYEKISIDSVHIPSLRVPVDNPSSLAKFGAGLLLFGGLLLLGFRDGLGSFIFASAIVFIPIFMALGIDHIRLHARWPLLFKLLISLIIFVVGFLLIVLTIGILDMRGM